MESFEVSISEADVPSEIKSEYDLIKSDKDNLGIKDGLDSFMSENFGRILLSKISKIIPKSYEVNEISLNITMKGELFGSGFSGQVSVKLKPK